MSYIRARDATVGCQCSTQNLHDNSHDFHSLSTACQAWHVHVLQKGGTIESYPPRSESGGEPPASRPTFAPGEATSPPSCLFFSESGLGGCRRLGQLNAESDSAVGERGGERRPSGRRRAQSRRCASGAFPPARKPPAVPEVRASFELNLLESTFLRSASTLLIRFCTFW